MRLITLEFTVAIGNAGDVELVRSEGRTNFQMIRLKEISDHLKFQHFCINPGDDENYRGPILVMWYENSVLWSERIGQHKVLRVFG